MCWNAPVSIVFSLLGFACAGFLYHVGRKAEKDPESTRWGADCKWHALFVGNVACVELCEFIIWLNVLDFWNELEPDKCPVWNKIGTFGVFTFGFANWSWVIGVWCGATCGGDERRRQGFRVWKAFSIVTSVFWFLSIFIGEAFEVGVEYVADVATNRLEQNLTRPIYYRIYDDMSPSSSKHSGFLVGLNGVPIKTCSFQETGLYPHLHWRFAMAHVPWMPSMGWTFFATMFLPFFFYRPLGRALVILLWGAATYLGPYAILPVEETMSVF